MIPQWLVDTKSLVGMPDELPSDMLQFFGFSLMCPEEKVSEGDIISRIYAIGALYCCRFKFMEENIWTKDDYGVMYGRTVGHYLSSNPSEQFWRHKDSPANQGLNSLKRPPFFTTHDGRRVPLDPIFSQQLPLP